MNTSTSIDSRLSTALRTATRIALRTATRAGRRPDSITIADGKSSNNSPDSAPRAHKPRTLTAPLFAAGRCFGLSPGTLRTPGANPPASPPRTLTHRALTLLAPLFLAGALLGVSSNAAAQLAVDLGADQTVAPGAQNHCNRHRHRRGRAGCVTDNVENLESKTLPPISTLWAARRLAGLAG